MDPLSALAIVAAVVQFADTGGRLLVKSWRKCKGRIGDIDPKSGNRWASELEFENALTELFLITQTVRGSADHVISHTTTRMAEKQLLQLCKECEDIANYFQQVLEKAKARPRASKYENVPMNGVTKLSGLWSGSEIRKMHRRLSTLQQSITTTIVLCIWEDSKKTKEWEAGFSEKLNEILSLLKRIEDSAPESRAHSHDSYDTDWLFELRPGDQQRPTNDLAHILSCLAVSDNIKIRDSLKETLDTDYEAVGNAYKPFTSRFWQKEWNPDPKSCIFTPPELKAMMDGLGFSTIHVRQDAIPQNFQSTYGWIFDRRPRCGPEGPMWHSFPNWLQGSSDSVYWITGKPGSGKSTMMKYIAGSTATTQYLQKWAGPLPVLAISYYAWIAGDSLQKSWDGLKRTMLLQAANKMPEIIPLVSPRRCALAEAKPDKEKFPDWESWEVEESFDLLLRKCGRTLKLALFIDGLDEFDLAPAVVVRLINDLASISTDFLKICVASRPWMEFDDAFRKVPMVQMHLLTKDDTRIFVAGQLKSNQGFKEILGVYPKQAGDLKEQIVSKSQGVFLWVAVVVKSILISLSEGASFADLQATLMVLPSDMSNLYDTIWARTEPRNRHGASWMIQLVTTAVGPLEGLTLWLAEESRASRIDVQQLPVNIEAHACVSVKRRLASRTRGLLELTGEGEGCVGFSHRTARDWSQQTEVWEDICSSYQGNLNPHLVLFEAKTLSFSIPKKLAAYTTPKPFRTAVMNMLWYASESSDSKADSVRLVEAMDFFDISVQKAYETAQRAWLPPDRVQPGKQHWSTKQNVSMPSLENHNTFLNIAAQFSILPYIQTKAEFGLDIPNLKPPKNGFSLLDHAVLGHEFFAPDTAETHQMSSKERRLSTVKFLLEAGAKPSKSPRANLSAERRERRILKCGLMYHYEEYYDEVTAMIRAAKNARLRSSIGRVFTIFRHS
ncbi:hypothetical protein PG984_010280 [Apiospora sp. TS-2023a]